MLAEIAVCICALVVGAESNPSPPPAAEKTEEKAQAKTAEKATEKAPEKASEEDADKSEKKDDKAAKKLKLIAIEKAIVAATNAERARFGLPPLEVDEELMESARAHCIWMTQNETLRHTRNPVAENIAMGQQSTEEAVGAWMRSPGHRANMLNGGFRRIGVAAYSTSRDVVFWCQQFRH
jgi:uncharacterized protein YkwD